MMAGLSSLKSGSNMGYITYFNLEMIGSDEDIANACEDAKTSGNELIAELLDGEYLEAKWYDFQTDFSDFAKRHPSILFIVTGDGEESDDLWEARFKGDISERQDFMIPPFKTLDLLTEDEIARRTITL